MEEVSCQKKHKSVRCLVTINFYAASLHSGIPVFVVITIKNLKL
jgi:hypothetical protein